MASIRYGVQRHVDARDYLLINSLIGCLPPPHTKVSFNTHFSIVCSPHPHIKFHWMPWAPLHPVHAMPPSYNQTPLYSRMYLNGLYSNHYHINAATFPEPSNTRPQP